MRIKAVTGALLGALVSTSTIAAECKVLKDGIFPADGEHVRLARDKDLKAAANFAVFRAPLAVNTDGAPTSYHPVDILGETLAINRFNHGIAIRDKATGKKPDLDSQVTVFKEWREADWVVPEKYKISWANVIADDGNGKPCVFQTGDNKGYFGSLTALKNGLPKSKRGECEYKNQLDQRYIPAIVLRGDANPLHGYGAKTGDLVLAINPGTGTTVTAVIGDTGNGNRIGEGSVALNMALLGKSDQPKTYPQAEKLDTGNKAMIIAVLPASRDFEPALPYTAANIETRVKSWAKTRGYGDLKALAAAATVCAKGL